jgi:uncharacterized protein YndB with AHSA1/START domain
MAGGHYFKYRCPVSQHQGTRQGYLLLADISGYTAFLTGTELEHAHGIINELTRLIRERLTPPMRFVKLEGDAVFCYADAESFEDGERFVELLEACYFGFSNRLLDMTRSTTCRCNACKAIGSLDLKFVTHYGSFMVERDGEREDLAGPDVILVHRLLKNTVGDDGGPAAYAFLTAPCLERMPESLELPAHTEAYESFGETTGGVHNLGPVLEQMREAQREYISSAEADFELSGEPSPYPPAVLWQYFVDPEKRLRWQPNQKTIDNQPNKQGRLGPGASSHCAHGIGPDVLREYLDWRPYEYFTIRFTPLGGGVPLFVPGVETTEFIPTDAGTTMVHYRFRATDRGRLTKLRVRLWAALFRKAAKGSGERCREIMREDGCREAHRSSAGVEEETQPAAAPSS